MHEISETSKHQKVKSEYMERIHEMKYIKKKTRHLRDLRTYKNGMRSEHAKRLHEINI